MRGKQNTNKHEVTNNKNCCSYLVHESSSKRTSPPTSSNFIETTTCELRNAQELSMQSLCKQIIKSRLFRGFYMERRYVESLQSYRDIVALEKGERELQKLLLDIRQRVLQFYWHDAPPHKWFGITSGKLCDAPMQAGATDTMIWTQLNELAYGQYWFSIKTIRFREKEVLLKLKMVRLVENDGREATLRRSMGPSLNTTPLKTETRNKDQTQQKEATKSELDNLDPPEPEIGLMDFAKLVQSWGTSIKRSIYDFMSNDITKRNILDGLKFLLLVIISLASGSMHALSYLGQFTLRFMYEISRLTHVLSPIVIKIIDLANRIIGGFYILLTMVWKDVFYHRGNVRKPMLQLESGKRVYQSIEYNVHATQARPPQTQRHVSVNSNAPAEYGEFERKFPM